MPVKGDHNILVSTSEGTADANSVRSSRVSAMGGGVQGGKHSRSTPSPPPRRKGTPSPTQHNRGRSGSASPRAQPGAPGSRTPSPRVTTPSPTLGVDPRGGGGSRMQASLSSEKRASPTTSLSAASKLHQNYTKAARARPAGLSRPGGQPRRTSSGRAHLSKSYDATTATTARDMQVIKGAFYADESAELSEATHERALAVPERASPSASPSVLAAVVSASASEQPALGSESDDPQEFDEELCSLHESSVHEDDLGSVSSIGTSFTSGSAVGSGAICPVPRNSRRHDETGSIDEDSNDAFVGGSMADEQKDAFDAWMAESYQTLAHRTAVGIILWTDSRTGSRWSGRARRWPNGC
eukprot:SAG11_NODE_1700_length_4412_cov_3.622803_3_plen_355_part_00